MILFSKRYSLIWFLAFEKGSVSGTEKAIVPGQPSDCEILTKTCIAIRLLVFHMKMFVVQ